MGGNGRWGRSPMGRPPSVAVWASAHLVGYVGSCVVRRGIWRVGSTAWTVGFVGGGFISK